MSRTLLLADGSVTIQRVVELTFAHEDIRVTAVSDGRKAIQMLETESPDVVLADVDLPEVDGYALAAHMRRVPRLKNVPVLLLAGAFEPVDQQKAREVGSDGVIIKPFEPQVVVNRVKELIDQRDRRSPAGQGREGGGACRPAEPKAVPPAPPEPARAAQTGTAFPRPRPDRHPRRRFPNFPLSRAARTAVAADLGHPRIGRPRPHRSRRCRCRPCPLPRRRAAPPPRRRCGARAEGDSGERLYSVACGGTVDARAVRRAGGR